jgi:hypothetical protein
MNRPIISGYFLIGILLLLGCAGKDKKNEGEISPEDIFFDYQLSGAEGDDNITIKLQYREGDEEGDGMAIREPGKIVVDGETIQADSTRMTGYFYELHKPMGSFAGTHTISFTAVNGKEYKEEFSFQPVSLLTPIADTIQRNELVLEFEGLDEKDQVRVLLTDTSFISDGLNQVDSVKNGRLVISREDLETIATGPVQLELIREYEKPVKNRTGAGGRLQINYSLKREFFLKD